MWLKLDMQTASAVQRLTKIFHARFSRRRLNGLHRRHCRPRRPARISFADLLLGLVYHAVMGQGRLETHLFEQTGELLSAPAISQRRQRLPWQLFRDLLAQCLQPRAERRRHPEAFYHGYRLVGLDGTCFGVHNVPRLVCALGKASTRRFKAAFALVRTVVLVELGLHNPMAAAIGRAGESEMELAWGLIAQLPDRSLLLADRLYGTPLFVGTLLARCLAVHGQFLVRIRRRLKTRLLEILPDGSALVELRVPCEDGEPCTFLVREIRGRVWGRGSTVTSLRLWTSLLDPAAHPAVELLALYAQRWEVELTIKELKMELRGSDRLASYTLDTAAQEIAALLLAQAVLVEARVLRSRQAAVAVLRISFRDVLHQVRFLWSLLALGEGGYRQRTYRAVLRGLIGELRCYVNPPRRARSCARAVRQPVSSWPRLLRRRETQGGFRYEVVKHPGSKR
jgi:hypothetical protein